MRSDWEEVDKEWPSSVATIARRPFQGDLRPIAHQLGKRCALAPMTGKTDVEQE